MKRQLLPLACISCILMLIITACAQQHQLSTQRHASFVKHASAVLDVVPITVAKVNDDIECFFSCLKSLVCCLSVNMAAVPDEEKYDCQLLGTDKYNSSNRLKPSQKYHHFSIQSPCELSPCQNGGRCHPIYEQQKYKCECAIDFVGADCGEKGLTIGSRVFSRWTNGLYYKGIIDSETAESFHVTYDDGDESTHSKTDSKAIVMDADPLESVLTEGTEVIAWWPNTVIYYSGRVDKIKDGSYHIIYDDGGEGPARLDQIRVFSV